MKVLISGATGAIGGMIMPQIISRKDVTQVIALTRRPLPEDISISHKKLQIILVEDFGKLENLHSEAWEMIQDADAMIWAMGTYNLNENVNLKYPLAFQEALAERRRVGVTKRNFKFVLLSGAFVEPDQSRRLLFLWDQRHMKGLLHTKTLEVAQRESWDGIIIRPGGILFGGDTIRNKVAEAVFGTGMVIGAEELGAAVGDLIVNGSKDSVVQNLELVGRGRKVLSSVQSSGENVPRQTI